MKTSETTGKIAPALIKAQAEMLPLIKDSKNPFFKSKYADLHAVTEACYPALQANGIAVIQSPESNGTDGLNIKTRLMHSSGEFIETDCAIPPAGQDPQKYGSAVTYGRRYGLQAAVGLAPTDDDGEGAMARSSSPAQAKKAPPAKSAGPPLEKVIASIEAQENLSDLKAKMDKANTTSHKGDEKLEAAYKKKKEELSDVPY